MDRRRFLRSLSLGGLVAWFAAMPAAVASTVESAVQVLSDIRDIALDSSLSLQERLDAIVAIVDGEIGPSTPSIVGDFAGTIPAGETWKITGDVNLTGDLIVEGTLTSVDTFTLQGNGHQIVFQHGGRSNLAGKPKTAWARRGDPVNGWKVGDLLFVAPTAVGDYTPKEAIWGGDWASTVILSEDVTLVDGSTARPEVANVSQTARIHNVSRVHFHADAGVASLANLIVVESGVPGLLDHYPIHFHHMGEASRGSTLTDVVVQGGKHHAFVPHNSNGITLTRCAAVGSVGGDSFWYNPGDRTEDLTYDACAVIGQTGGVVSSGTRNTGFWLGKGIRNVARGCVAAGVVGTQFSAGFLWPENDHGGWDFVDCVTHNGNGSGFVHYIVAGDVDGFRSYHCGRDGASQLTYRAHTQFRRMVLNEKLHVSGASNPDWKGWDYLSNPQPMRFTECQAPLLSIGDTPVNPSAFTEHLGCEYGAVTVSTDFVLHKFIDSKRRLTPEDFTVGSNSATVLSIVESGVEVHRYEANAWVS